MAVYTGTADRSILTRRSTRLASFKQPKHYAQITELPRNAMGKVQKAELRKDYGALLPRDARGEADR